MPGRVCRHPGQDRPTSARLRSWSPPRSPIVPQIFELDRKFDLAAKVAQTGIRRRGGKQLQAAANGCRYSLTGALLRLSEEILRKFERNFAIARHGSQSTSVDTIVQYGIRRWDNRPIRMLTTSIGRVRDALAPRSHR